MHEELSGVWVGLRVWLANLLLDLGFPIRMAKAIAPESQALQGEVIPEGRRHRLTPFQCQRTSRVSALFLFRLLFRLLFQLLSNLNACPNDRIPNEAFRNYRLR